MICASKKWLSSLDFGAESSFVCFRTGMTSEQTSMLTWLGFARRDLRHLKVGLQRWNWVKTTTFRDVQGLHLSSLTGTNHHWGRIVINGDMTKFNPKSETNFIPARNAHSIQWLSAVRTLALHEKSPMQLFIGEVSIPIVRGKIEYFGKNRQWKIANATIHWRSINSYCEREDRIFWKKSPMKNRQCNYSLEKYQFLLWEGR